jgi:hypothetical protein
MPGDYQILVGGHHPHDAVTPRRTNDTGMTLIRVDRQASVGQTDTLDGSFDEGRVRSLSHAIKGELQGGATVFMVKSSAHHFFARGSAGSASHAGSSTAGACTRSGQRWAPAPRGTTAGRRF